MAPGSLSEDIGVGLEMFKKKRLKRKNAAGIKKFLNVK